MGDITFPKYGFNLLGGFIQNTFYGQRAMMDDHTMALALFTQIKVEKVTFYILYLAKEITQLELNHCMEEHWRR